MLLVKWILLLETVLHQHAAPCMGCHGKSDVQLYTRVC